MRAVNGVGGNKHFSQQFIFSLAVGNVVADSFMCVSVSVTLRARNALTYRNDNNTLNVHCNIRTDTHWFELRHTYHDAGSDDCVVGRLSDILFSGFIYIEIYMQTKLQAHGIMCTQKKIDSAARKVSEARAATLARTNFFT